MQIHFRNLLLAAPIFLLAACSKTNTQGKLIPKEAAFVLQIDGKSLSSKLSWDEIKQNTAFTEISKDSSVPSTIKTILNNPDSAGIDTKADLLLFALQDSAGGYVAVEGSIKNEDQFKTFVKTLAGGGSENEADGIKFISKEPLCVGYTKEKFVYIFDTPQMAGMDALSKRMQQDSIDVTPVTKPRDIFSTCKAVFALTESNSLAKNDRFSQLMKEPGDMHFWMNTEELTKKALSNPMLAMVNVDKLYKGSLTTAAIDFENGKINITAKSYVGDDLAKLYKKYGDGKVNEDMLKRMPGKDIIGLMAIAYKPEGIKELLKLMNLDGIANMGLIKIGFTMDDFIKANKGDLVLGVSDLGMKSDSSTHNDESYTRANPFSFNFIFATSIGDKDAFNKLINVGKKMGGEAFGDAGNAPFAYNSNGTYFAIANNKETADKYLAGTNSNVDFINKISGQAFAGYLNIHLLLKSFEKEATKDSSASAAYDASLKLWDNVLIKGGDIKDDGISQTIEVNLVDKTTNSLKQLNQYAATLTEIYKARKEKEKAMEAAFDSKLPAEDIVAPPASIK